MTPISLPSLLALVSAATKGPYRVGLNEANWLSEVRRAEDGETIACCDGLYDVACKRAAYFAALSPEVVTALCRVVEAAKEAETYIRNSSEFGIVANINETIPKNLTAALAPFEVK